MKKVFILPSQMKEKQKNNLNKTKWVECTRIGGEARGVGEEGGGRG